MLQEWLKKFLKTFGCSKKKKRSPLETIQADIKQRTMNILQPSFKLTPVVFDSKETHFECITLLYYFPAVLSILSYGLVSLMALEVNKVKSIQNERQLSQQTCYLSRAPL